MRARRFFLPMLLAGLLSCASEARRDAAAPTLPAGLGQLCVKGPTPSLFVQALAIDDSILKPKQTGEHTCIPIAPGLTRAVTQREDTRELLDAWVDAGETTTIELGPASRITATAAQTEQLGRILQHGRCAFGDCSAKQLADALAQLELAQASASVRERQVARLLAWSLLDEDDHAARQRLAAAIWAELAADPLVAASFHASLTHIASSLGERARRELERMAIEASGVGEHWSPYIRHHVLLSLMRSAGVGAEADGLRARVRAATATDPRLRESPLRAAVIEAAGFEPQVIARGEAVARSVVAPFAGEPCERDSRWLLYVHSPACPACEPAVQQLAALLDQGDARLRVVTVSVEGDPPPFAERSEVEAVGFAASLAAWFDEARGGVATPYFMGLACDDASLRLVGLGSLADATRWDARAVTAQ